MGKTLAEHAAYELTKAGMTDNEDGEARKVATDVIALVRRFEKQGHTEKSARFVLEAFERICNFLPLTPITDDPDEWEKFTVTRKNNDTGEEEEKVTWQSKRASSIFSDDEGKTFYDARTGKSGTSVDHIEQAKNIEEEKQDRERRKKAADGRLEKPIGHLNPDVPAGEAEFTTPVAPEAAKPAAPKQDSAKKEKK